MTYTGPGGLGFDGFLLPGLLNRDESPPRDELEDELEDEPEEPLEELDELPEDLDEELEPLLLEPPLLAPRGKR